MILRTFSKGIPSFALNPIIFNDFFVLFLPGKLEVCNDLNLIGKQRDNRRHLLAI